MSLGTIDTRVRDLSPAGSNCTRYLPREDDSSTEWVSNPGTAWGAHGSPCPTGSNAEANLDQQSAVGFAPSDLTAVATGETFVLGKVVHRNNAISNSAEHTTGVLDVRFAGYTAQFPWDLWETENDGTCEVGPPIGDCQDQIAFTEQVGDGALSIDGLSYTLVVDGFVRVGSATASCPDPSALTVENQFLTDESAVTAACLYGTIQQVRTVTVAKEIVVPDGVAPPASTPFGFATTSTLDGTPWDPQTTGAGNFSLTPSLKEPASLTRSYTSGNTISVTEQVPEDWTLTSLTCVDGLGASVGSIDGATLSLAPDTLPAAATAQEAPVTCTYVNTYSPPLGSFTVSKAIEPRAGVTPGYTADTDREFAFGYSCTVGDDIVARGNATMTTATPATVTNVPATALCTITEEATGTQDGDFIDNSYAWDGNSGPASVTISEGETATATITNYYTRTEGDFAVTKTSVPPSGTTVLPGRRSPTRSPSPRPLRGSWRT